MRKILLGLSCLIAAGAALAAQGFVDLFNAATAAYNARDYKTMELRLAEALALRPAHPSALYKLASAQVLRGDAAAALDTLDTLVNMGLSFDPSKDADFAALASDARFAGISARFAHNREPVGSATPLFRVFTPTFIPEGIAYDRDSGAYYLGGAHEREIVRMPRGGQNAEDFVNPGAGGLWAPLGMQADSARRLLWVATAAIPQMRNAESQELGRSAVLAYDLDSGRLKRRHLLPDDGAEHLLGDLVVLRKGTIYTTDSKAGVLYALDSTSGKFTALSRPGQLASPQGLTLSSDKKTLYVADYTQGLFAWDIEKKTLSRLEVGADISVYGIDGLYEYENSLVAVQNGIRPHRVVRFKLDPSGRRVLHARVLAANLPEFDEPTLGVVVGNRFSFVANSQWNRFDEKNKLPPKDQLRSPIVLRISLDGA